MKKTQYHSDFLLLIPDVPSYTQMPVLFLFSGRNRATLDWFLDGSPEMMRGGKGKVVLVCIKPGFGSRSRRAGVASARVSGCEVT